MSTESFNEGIREPQEQEPATPDIISKKYEELRKARITLLELRNKNAINMTFEEVEKITAEIQRLESVIPQLEKEFEGLKKNKAVALEEKFGSAATNQRAANDSAFDEALRVTGEARTADRLAAAKARNKKIA